MTSGSLHVRWSSHFFAILMALAAVAFWPGYLAVPKLSLSGWLHFHAATGTLWILMLIVQPWAIRTGRRALHVSLGRLSFVLVPLIVVAFVGLAHSSMQGKSPQEQAVDAYFLYIRVVLVAMFAGTYFLGVLHRKDPEVHSRYMLCTGLSFVDPVFHRIAHRAMGGADFNYQLLTFGAVCTILLLLIIAARHAPSGRRALVAVLVAFLLGGLPVALNFHTWGVPWKYWKLISSYFASLPLT